jgi:4-carboxymuconolactone decarboxylase
MLRLSIGYVANIGALVSLLSVGAQAQERFTDLRMDQLTPEQQRMVTMLSTPPRNNKITSPPFNLYARSPDLGIRLLELSDYVRFNSSLPPRLSEFAIMIAAREWSQPYVWRAHYPLAIKGGLARGILVDLGADKHPAGMKDDEAALYDFCVDMHRDKNVSDAAFKTALANLGEREIMDVIGIIGYYGLVSMTLITEGATGTPGDEPPMLPR